MLLSLLGQGRGEEFILFSWLASPNRANRNAMAVATASNGYSVRSTARLGHNVPQGDGRVKLFV